MNVDNPASAELCQSVLPVAYSQGGFAQVRVVVKKEFVQAADTESVDGAAIEPPAGLVASRTEAK